MDWKDEFKQKLADAGVEMFQKPSLNEFQSMAKELEKLKAQKYSLDELISMAKELETLKVQVSIQTSTKSPLNELQSMAKELEKLKTQNPEAPKQFTLKHTFTNISKMDEWENKKSLIEYHFNVLWYVEIQHRSDDLAVFLWCKRNSDIPWSVQCAYQIEIIHPSGKTKARETAHAFESGCRFEGWWSFMDWKEMKKEYLDGDQLTVVVNVTINEITGIYLDSCLQSSTSSQKQFTLKHIFTNISKMDKGEKKKSLIEYHYNVPWFVKIEYKNNHLAVHLYCNRASDIPWSVECAYQIQIVHPSGKTLSQEWEDVFKTTNGEGFSLFMKWDEMKKEYLDGDQLTVVVNVNINKMTGF